jgi:hypothetical protein
MEASSRRLSIFTIPPRTTMHTTATAAPADHARQWAAKCRRIGSADRAFRHALNFSLA